MGHVHCPRALDPRGRSRGGRASTRGALGARSTSPSTWPEHPQDSPHRGAPPAWSTTSSERPPLRPLLRRCLVAHVVLRPARAGRPRRWSWPGRGRPPPSSSFTSCTSTSLEYSRPAAGNGGGPARAVGSYAAAAAGGGGRQPAAAAAVAAGDGGRKPAAAAAAAAGDGGRKPADAAPEPEAAAEEAQDEQPGDGGASLPLL